MNRYYLITAIVLAACMAVAVFWWQHDAVTAALPLHRVDEQQCRICHQPQFRDWSVSHHRRAMQLPSDTSVRGDFSGQSLTEGDETTTFLRQGDEFLVRIGNPSGEQTLRVAWTFGWEPLQQYLLAMDDGRLQALGVAWDTQQQRWFHLYEGMNVDARHPLHWSKPAQNANTQCIECHSTGFQTGYDTEHDRFDSRWHMAGIGCQSCHGAASAHLAWAASPDNSPGKGFAVQLAPGQQQLETCARCHSRRTPLGEPASQQVFDDAYLLSLLSADLYEVDGAISGEVFEHGSFLQSRMHQAGVVCSDCHNPHSGRLKADGNAVCTQCHNPAATPVRAAIQGGNLRPVSYDSPAHHHHTPGSAGAECRNCHMPGKLYMGNDLRHDHSFSSPDPVQAQALGHSDACLDCHAGQDADNLISRFRQWYPGHQPRDGGYAEALFKARHGKPGAATTLHRQLARTDLPAVRRAALVAELPNYPSSASQQWLLQALQHEDAAVRRAAVDNAAALLDAGQLQTALAGLLNDPRRAVRISAAGQWLALADQQGAQLPPDFLAEYEQIQQQLAANAEAHFSLANLYRLSGRTAQVQPALQSALRLNPDFSPAVVLLAQWQERNGDTQATRSLLEQHIRQQPGDAMLHHALGLAQIRAGQRDAALLSLEQAYRLAPDNDNYAWVLAIAWHDTGRRDAALQLLRTQLQQHPASRSLRLALLTYLPAGPERDTVLHAWQQQNPQDPLLPRYLSPKGDKQP